MKRLFIVGEVSQSFMTWQFNSFTGITDLVLIPEGSLSEEGGGSHGYASPAKG